MKSTSKYPCEVLQITYNISNNSMAGYPLGVTVDVVNVKKKPHSTILSKEAGTLYVRDYDEWVNALSYLSLTVNALSFSSNFKESLTLINPKSGFNDLLENYKLIRDVFNNAKVSDTRFAVASVLHIPSGYIMYPLRLFPLEKPTIMVKTHSDFFQYLYIRFSKAKLLEVMGIGPSYASVKQAEMNYQAALRDEARNKDLMEHYTKVYAKSQLETIELKARWESLLAKVKEQEASMKEAH